MDLKSSVDRELLVLFDLLEEGASDERQRAVVNELREGVMTLLEKVESL